MHILHVSPAVPDRTTERIRRALAERFTVDEAADLPDASSLLALQSKNGSYDFDACVISIEVRDRQDDIRALCRTCPMVPIILLTMQKPISKYRAEALTNGADDCLPVLHVSNEELQAVLYRRILARNKRPVREIEIGNLVIDLIGRTARCDENATTFRPSEWAILEKLALKHPDVVSIEILSMLISHTEEPASTDMLRVAISWLRRKLKELDTNVRIHTSHGVGYQLEVAE